MPQLCAQSSQKNQSPTTVFLFNGLRAPPAGEGKLPEGTTPEKGCLCVCRAGCCLKTIPSTRIPISIPLDFQSRPGSADCHQHLLSCSAWCSRNPRLPVVRPGMRSFPRARHFTLFVVCILVSLLSGTRVCACVLGGIIVPLMIAILITGCNCHCGWKPINAL